MPLSFSRFLLLFTHSCLMRADFYLIANKPRFIEQPLLLDFGAVRDFPEDLLALARKMTRAAFYKDRDGMRAAMTGFTFFDTMAASTKEGIIDLFFLAIEPFSDLKDVVKITTSTKTPDGEQMKKINEVVDRLCNDHGYCPICANELLKYVGTLLNR